MHFLVNTVAPYLLVQNFLLGIIVTKVIYAVISSNYSQNRNDCWAQIWRCRSYNCGLCVNNGGHSAVHNTQPTLRIDTMTAFIRGYQLWKTKRIQFDCDKQVGRDAERVTDNELLTVTSH